MTQLENSTPTFSEFDPTLIPFQARVLDDIFFNYDYSLGTHEILLSGSVGSAKSILMAHIILRLAVMFPHANILLGRRSLPDLKETIYRKIIDHMEGSFEEGKHYNCRDNIAHIEFANRSTLISRSWADKRYLKVRSLELTAACFEELTENNSDDKRIYDETIMRIGRTPHIPLKFIISATNPDDPTHWAYKHFIEPNTGKKHPTRHVYYSITENNPFLPKEYVRQLKENLDPKMARRMLYGEWLSITEEVVYHAYRRENNYRDEDYVVNAHLPIHLCFDFNIGEGKPMSCALMQFDWPYKHVFDESVIHSARTEQILEDLEARGLIKQNFRYVINGDAAGKHRDTRNFRSDYDIIMAWFQRRGLHVELHVPAANPPVRTRHNNMNAEFLNALGESRLFVYKNAKTADEAFRLTKLKKGAGYIEDDSKAYQHIGTAVGYAVCYEALLRTFVPNKVQLL